jgi:hypothetical protein
MPFIRIAPQIFENTDGYTVQVGSRTAMEYLEKNRKAIIEVEFGPTDTCIYENRLSGWFCGGQESPMSEIEKDRVVARVVAALRFDGSRVQISTY